MAIANLHRQAQTAAAFLGLGDQFVHLPQQTLKRLGFRSAPRARAVLGKADQVRLDPILHVRVQIAPQVGGVGRTPGILDAVEQRSDVAEIGGHFGEKQVVIGKKQSLRLLDNDPEVIAHPARVSEPLRVSAQMDHEGIIGAQRVQGGLGSLRMRGAPTPGPT